MVINKKITQKQAATVLANVIDQTSKNHIKIGSATKKIVVSPRHLQILSRHLQFPDGLALAQPLQSRFMRCMIWALRQVPQNAAMNNKHKQPPVEQSQMSQRPVLHWGFRLTYVAVFFCGATDGWRQSNKYPSKHPSGGTVTKNRIPSTSASKRAPASKVAGALTLIILGYMVSKASPCRTPPRGTRAVNWTPSSSA
mmetsp:Transcript_10324/g.25978  ORF Transcript_10324/g.25978 Transcript_10324/m.25978 type:complete len:197 (-) Transcript_10324:318-908(-)